MDYDARNLIEELKKIGVIKLTKAELVQQCEVLEQNLEIPKKGRGGKKKLEFSFHCN
jgi:hypothetical protein